MPPLPPIRWTGRAEFLLLRWHPELLGVLQLYVVLMLAGLASSGRSGTQNATLSVPLT